MGRRKKTYEEFVAEVEALVGDEFEVVGEYKMSRVKVGMRHRVCGEFYEVTPDNFLKGSRCPKCSNNKKKTTEDFKQEVLNLVGDEYEVLGIYKTGHTKIKIHHKKCGETYYARPTDFLEGCRCPRCRESKGERAIKQWLIDKGIEFTVQVPIKYDDKRYPLFLDFFVHGVAIEYDGEFHYLPKEYAGGEDSLRDTQRRDQIKDKYCSSNGIPLIRIPYWDFEAIDTILTEKLLPLVEDRRA